MSASDTHIASNLKLCAGTEILQATAILKHLTVRTHTCIAGKRWARLWYLLRAVDVAGSGYLTLRVNTLSSILNLKLSTLREILREGKRDKAFRFVKFSCGEVRIALGSLSRVTQALKLHSWGATATVPLIELVSLMGCRSTGTAIESQDKQKKSRIAAIRSLKPRERKAYKLPEVEAIFRAGQTASQKSVGGTVFFLLGTSETKVFVSNGWINFGATQFSVAAALGISDRTVRNHLNHLGVERRQVVQGREAYKDFVGAIDHDAEECWSKPKTPMEAVLRFEPQDPWGQYRLVEPNGATSSRYRAKVTRDHFFWSDKYGRYFIYRPNIYLLDYRTTSMRAARQEYKRLLAQS